MNIQDSYGVQNFPCTSIFKDGAAATSSEAFTQVWIEMINRIEKNKQVLAGKV